MSYRIQQSPCIIRVKHLRLRTFIGFNPEEREKRQDVVINAEIHYDSSNAARSDIVEEALDYKKITKKIIQLVEDNRFLLLERLTQDILNIVMENPMVLKAEVEVDKPHALRFADSVSVMQSAERTLTTP